MVNISVTAYYILIDYKLVNAVNIYNHSPFEAQYTKINDFFSKRNHDKT